MLKIEHVQKRYQFHKVLDDICMEFPDCGFISIVGPSGCGKSTLLHIIGGIDCDFQGDILLDYKRVNRYLTKYRKEHVSFIFQQFYLVLWLSVYDNIHLSKFFKKIPRFSSNVDDENITSVRISSLSFGQRQRIALLRAQCQQSDILLCDEPTGSLDPLYARKVMEILKKESQSKLVIIISHDLSLVKEFSDEIYEMKDGRIIDHQLYHQGGSLKKVVQKAKRYTFSNIRLAFYSLLSHKGRFFQLVSGLTLSLLCIIFTFTMSRGLEQQIQDYLYSIVPASGISFQLRNHQSLDTELITQFESLDSIIRCQLYLDDYECLGVGFVGDRYQESQTLFIGDDTAPYERLSLSYGHYPQSKEEIVVSASTAKHLCQSDDISTLIGKKLYAWYKHDQQVKAIVYHVVGISQNTTTMDTIYQQSNAYIELLSKVYRFDVAKEKCLMGILYVNPYYERNQVVKELEKNYLQYKFLEIGASTSTNISSTMNKIQIVFVCFSFLAILSSLFLIGEVMFLNILQKKKDFAIFRCYGAHMRDILKIVLYESFFIVLCSQILTTLFYDILLKGINFMLSDYLFIEQVSFHFDIQLLFFVYGACYLVVFFSQIPAFIYVSRLNTVEVLKG